MTAEESGGIPILYKSVGPCLDISSESFVSGSGPADVDVAELRNQFSRVILLFCTLRSLSRFSIIMCSLLVFLILTKNTY